MCNVALCGVPPPPCQGGRSAPAARHVCWRWPGLGGRGPPLPHYLSRGPSGAASGEGDTHPCGVWRGGHVSLWGCWHAQARQLKRVPPAWCCPIERDRDTAHTGGTVKRWAEAGDEGRVACDSVDTKSPVWANPRTRPGGGGAADENSHAPNIEVPLSVTL